MMSSMMKMRLLVAGDMDDSKEETDAHTLESNNYNRLGAVPTQDRP
jgi:hypothetical protein